MNWGNCEATGRSAPERSADAPIAAGVNGLMLDLRRIRDGELFLSLAR